MPFGVDKPGATDLEMNRGVILPVHAYPLFENALRAANGWTLQEHAARIGALWARFSEVAAANPHAWIRTPRPAADIVTPGPRNRMVSFPYPKLCTANMQVDQGAGYIVCSAEAARAAGVPAERWVFPLAGADANDHWFISQRAELHRSPAIRLAGAAALGLAGLGIDDVASIDLYSCFPVVVQMAAAELGLPVDDPARPLTLTGGLTFGGGPGNNYTSHGIARAVGALRADSGERRTGHGTGLVRHQALDRDLRLPAPRARGGRALRLARRATRGRRPAAVPGRRRCDGAGARRDVHRDVRSRRRTRARHPRLPNGGGQPRLGQRQRPRHPRPPLRRGGHRAHRGPRRRRDGVARRLGGRREANGAPAPAAGPLCTAPAATNLGCGMAAATNARVPGVRLVVSLYREFEQVASAAT